MNTTGEIFDRYQSIRQRLPNSPNTSVQSTQLNNLGSIEKDFDVFLFDAFGVLNVGETVIPGAPERLKSIKDQGKQIYILTNAAGYQNTDLLNKFLRLGFDVSQRDIISSREVLIDAVQKNALALNQNNITWGVISICKMSDFPKEFKYVLYDRTKAINENDAFWSVDAYMFLSSGNWTAEDQVLLLQHMKKSPKPIVIGNPDLVAPREDKISLEPGYFVHEILDQTNVTAEFFGKPYKNAFDMAIHRAIEENPSLSLSRIIMLGDTLHTDILGGAHAGIKTGLVTNFGTYSGHDVMPYIGSSAITPDFIMPTI